MSIFAALNAGSWFGVSQKKKQNKLDAIRAFVGSFPMSVYVNTDKCKILRVGMKVVLNEEWREYAWVKAVDIEKGKIVLSLIIDKKYSQEEIDNFPLRVVHDTKQYLK